MKYSCVSIDRHLSSRLKAVVAVVETRRCSTQRKAASLLNNCNNLTLRDNGQLGITNYNY